MLKKIKELRSTERGKTIFKLSLYMIFFVFVIILVIATKGGENPYLTSLNSTSDGSESKVTTESRELTYFEKQKRLLEEKYEFDYKIEEPATVEYYGTYDDGKVEGFKETKNDLIKYMIEDGKVYSLKLGERSEYENLYDGLDSSIFNLKDLFEKLNMTSSTISRNKEDKIYNYLDVEGVDYIVYTGEESIYKIEAVAGDVVYELNFKF